MRLKKAKFKNLKCYVDSEFDFNGKSVVVFGKNGVGKSTIFQGLDYLMFEDRSMKLPDPIKRGETEGEAVYILVDENGTEYEAKLSFKQGKNGVNEKLIFSTDTGAKWDRKGRENLLGNGEARTKLDIIEFMRSQKTAAGKRENLRNIFQPMLGLDFEASDAEYKRLYEERALIGRDITAVTGLLTTQGITREDIGKEWKKKDASGIGAELQAARKKASDIESALSDIEKKKQQIAALEAEIKGLESFLDKAGIPEDTTRLQEAYEEAVAWNSRVDNINSLKPKIEELEKNTVQQEKLTKKLEKIKKDRVKQAAKASEKIPEPFVLDMDKPIEEGGSLQLYYLQDGEKLLFEEGIVNRGRMILATVSLGIGLLEKTNIRTLTIQDASLLDPDTMREVVRICEENGFQALLEVVDDNPNVSLREYEIEIEN